MGLLLFTGRNGVTREDTLVGEDEVDGVMGHTLITWQLKKFKECQIIEISSYSR